MNYRVGLVISLGLVALVAVLVAGVTAASAAEAMHGGAKWTLSLTKDYTASPWTKEMGYKQRAGSKLGFGAKNLLLGWTELYTETKEQSQGGANVLKSLGMGLKNAVEDEVGGIVHLITFPITELDAPLPEGGTQAMS